MRKTILIITLLLCLSDILTASPRLTVVVAVDGLNQENLSMLRPYWSKGGLRTLSEEAYQTSFGYPHPVYGTIETLATIVTGRTPSEHGLSMATSYDRKTRRPYALLTDKQEKGIGTHIGWSPRALLTPTITDILRMREGTDARIYAVGIHPEQTILLAGHAANTCCWLDSTSHKWVSTTYYSEGLPAAADQMNMSERMNEKLSRTWTPRMDIHTYNRPTDEEKKRSFSYDMNNALHSSPIANELVVDMALDLQEQYRMGLDLTPDMLLLELTAETPKAASDRIGSAEQEDQYLWLNQHIGFLLEQLDKRIGKQNYQILLIGLPHLGESHQTLQMARLTQRIINVDRIAALTGTYLMALYGHERWVDGGYGQSIYLNRTLIEQKHLSLETIERQVAHFLLEFEGIAMAYPQHESFLAPGLSTWVNKRSTGDVVFTLEPGCVLYADENHRLDAVVESYPHSPLLFWSGAFRSFPEQTFDATQVISLLND